MKKALWILLGAAAALALCVFRLSIAATDTCGTCGEVADEADPSTDL